MHSVNLTKTIVSIHLLPKAMKRLSLFWVKKVQADRKVERKKVLYYKRQVQIKQNIGGEQSNLPLPI